MTQTILIARNLSRHYRVARGFFKPASFIQALNHVSFELAVGHTLAVVGESGCGKSTLARQLTRVETPTSGELQLDGINMLDPVESKRLRSKIQMVFQHPHASLNPRKPVRSILDEPLFLNTNLSRYEREEKIHATLASVGLRPEHFHRYPHMFSGGQCQRIAIARAMILNPRVIVADEPTSSLDVPIQAQILNLFMDLQEQFGTSYVFVSHNLSVVEYIAHQVMVMYFGSVVEYGTRKAIYELPLHPYTRALMSATPAIRAEDRPNKVKLVGELPSPFDPPSGCAFHTRCPYAVDRCRIEVPLLRMVSSRLVACHRIEEIG